jgi:pimeloyl-ACP methyl ester carboxylesterase
LQKFSIDITDAALDDLRRRLDMTRWTDDFANDDWRFGANANAIRQLAAYWRDEYDWRAREKMMNRFDHFRVTLDDIPIHFIHARGQGPKPIPLILNHGWPWTFWDFHKIIGPLSDPVAFGGNAADAFDVVVPSLPGYIFSTPLKKIGINFWRTADLWVELMQQLGYARFATHGGDWGSFISAQLGHKYADRIIGLHIHTPAPLNFMDGQSAYEPSDFGPDDAPLLAKMARMSSAELGYFILQKTKPQTPAVALADSPVGLLAWIVEKRRSWSDCNGDLNSRFSNDELLDTIMLYWLTNSYHTSARFYYECAHNPWKPSHQRTPIVEAPVAIPILPAELTVPTRKWAQRYYNLQRWREFSEGGHFAPMEVPELLVEDIREFFRDKRN